MVNSCLSYFAFLQKSSKTLWKEGTLHFFLSQKEKSSKKEVGERAARALSALARKAREALRESPHIRAEPFAWRKGIAPPTVLLGAPIKP